ncbi:hypothetical protein [Aliivibrio finisterrensis]|uniref:Porin family protein n=1 Tax=Aliivibrio finisterrensis TaxID=511998 RepID=A0A6N6RVK0_9GAMM|nr:hypothetical protein [Aliivibrio finisterrensis]KAB2825755.1 hypothetical protein F8B77_03415 [Aliivibrio finisterrensis]
MNMKTTLFSLFTVGLVVAGNVNAATTSGYFMGASVGANLSGGVEGQGYTADLESTKIMGINGGLILENVHRITLAYQHQDLKFKDFDEKTGLSTVKAKYDYMFSLANNLSWTVGGQLGNEMYDEKLNQELNGMIYGAQTGLDYRLGNWSAGAEVEYVLHNAEGLGQTIANQANFMTNVAYHF